MPIDIEQIRRLVPHSGAMCLLQRVVECNAESIRCEARSHTDPANPLRRNGHLSSICGIEYAAQAMALHSVLGSPGASDARSRAAIPRQPRHGYLVSVRETRCYTRYLDTITTVLDVRTQLVFGDASQMIYTFMVGTNQTALVSGRASIMLG